MTIVMSACGNLCSDCPAYVAGRTHDRTRQERIAAAWQKIYDLTFPPETITCGGCPGDQPAAFVSCRQCAVRLCVTAKGLAHCALCEEYPCAKLDKAQADFDGLESMADKLSEEEFAEFVAPYCHARDRLAAALRRPWDWS